MKTVKFMCDYYFELKKHKSKLSHDQYRLLKGQIRSGQGEAAMKGLQTILNRRRGGSHHIL